MQAIIKSIKLNKNSKGNFLSIKLYNEQGDFISTFGSDKINDPVNFRTFLFGIMASCNCFDLLNLSSEHPKEKEIEFYCFPNNSKIIINQNNLALMKHKDGTYYCDTFNPHFKKLCELTKIPKEKGHITSIKSASGVFNIGIQSYPFYTNFVTNQIYYGFAYLWGNKEYKQEDILTSSTFFYTFIESVLKLYDTDDILKLNGKPDKYPKVNVILDNSGNIIALQDINSSFTLYESENQYFVSNDPNIDLSYLINKEKPKSLLKKIFNWRT